MDIGFEQLLILVVAAVVLLLRFLQSRSSRQGEDGIPSRSTSAPYHFPEDATEAWSSPSPTVEPARQAQWSTRTMPAASAPAPARQPRPKHALPAAARTGLLVPPAAIRPRSPWLAPMVRDRNALRRAIVLLTVLGPPRALAAP